MYFFRIRRKVQISIHVKILKRLFIPSWSVQMFMLVSIYLCLKVCIYVIWWVKRYHMTLSHIFFVRNVEQVMIVKWTKITIFKLHFINHKHNHNIFLAFYWHDDDPPSCKDNYLKLWFWFTRSQPDYQLFILIIIK